MICDIYDNVLEPHVAELIDMEMKEIVKKERKRRRSKIADSDLSEFMQ